jgi:hypothetical protein
MNNHKRSHRHFGVLLTLVAAVAAQGIALADIQVQGSTAGSAFYQGGQNIGTGINFGLGSSLSYTAASFGVQSSNLALDLGSFNLNCLLCAKNFNGYTFDLDLTFQGPAGIGAQTIQGDLSGTVYGIFGLGIDSVGVNFGGPTRFTYSGANGSGQFYVAVNDVTPGSITDFSNVALTGSIIGLNTTTAGPGGSAVPEPGSIVLLGTMLTVLSFIMRKKFSAKALLRRSEELNAPIIPQDISAQ